MTWGQWQCASLQRWTTKTTTSKTTTTTTAVANQSLRTSTQNGTTTPTNYTPSAVETYLLEHARPLGYHQNPASGCSIWNNSTLTPYYETLHQFLINLERYNQAITERQRKTKQSSSTPAAPDVRTFTDKQTQCNDPLYDDIDPLQIFEHPNNNDQQKQHQSHILLSHMEPYGYMEPLLPPMRHPQWCLPPTTSNHSKQKPPPRNNPPYLLDIHYLIHDFAQFCRVIAPQSRTVFVDMGASLNFEFHKQETPVLQVLELYQQFGIYFDHIYAFELKPEPPADVFAKVPRNLLPAYHWMNVGVETDKNSKLNPWNLLKDQYQADDFVVVKLDVDNTPIELELLRQLVNDPQLLSIVDVLYFEHHVSLTEWFPYQETMEQSLQLFADLRAHGIAARYWV
jgi:hypothetical protein